jgi:hypothetical protein
MSAYGMKPRFTNWRGYNTWLREWQVIYAEIGRACRSRKAAIRTAQRLGNYTESKQLLGKYAYDRVMATKMLTLRNEAVIRWHNIKSMLAGLKLQAEELPVRIVDAKNIDFHFNKKHLEFPQVPPWILKAKGRTYYINHLECTIPWSTRERPEDPSTKGMIRIKRGTVLIDTFRNAIINQTDIK